MTEDHEMNPTIIPNRSSFIMTFPHDDILPYSLCEDIHRILLDRIDHSLPLCATAVVKTATNFVVFLYGFYGEKGVSETAYCRVWTQSGSPMSDWWRGTLADAREIWNGLKNEPPQFERIL